MISKNDDSNESNFYDEFKSLFEIRFIDVNYIDIHRRSIYYDVVCVHLCNLFILRKERCGKKRKEKEKERKR